MSQEIIDENEAEDGIVLTTVSKLHWKLACSWMITSSVIGIIGCLIGIVVVFKSGAFTRMRFESILALGFAGLMLLKFILQIYNAYQTKKSVNEDDKPGIESSVRTYKMIWIFMGLLAAFFMFCMLAYWAGKIEILGKFSIILFKLI